MLETLEFFSACNGLVLSMCAGIVGEEHQRAGWF